MAEFFSFLKVFMLCSTLLFMATLVLLALPQSRLRAVGLEMTKWAIALGLVVLVPAPVDLIPDAIPGIGWLDDIGYIVGAVCAAKSAMGDRKRRTILEELEFEELVESKRRAKLRPANDDGGESDEREAA